MKHFFVTIQLWVRLILSIVSSETQHCRERNQRVRWVRLVRRCWSVRSLLHRIVRGDNTYIKGWVWDEGPYLDYVEFNGEAVTLLDVVTSTWVMRDWYFAYVTWDKMSIPAPWVNKFYGFVEAPYMVIPHQKVVSAQHKHSSFGG